MDIIYTKSPERREAIARKQRLKTDIRRLHLIRARDEADESFFEAAKIALIATVLLIGVRLADLVSGLAASAGALLLLGWFCFRLGSWAVMRRKREEAIRRCR